MKPLPRILILALGCVACGYTLGVWLSPRPHGPPLIVSSMTTERKPAENDFPRNLETSWQAALTKKDLAEVDLIQCARTFLLLPETERARALHQNEKEAGDVLDWFTTLHQAAMVVDSIPQPEKPVGTRAEFNKLLANSPEDAAKQLRGWLMGSWSEKSYAFALLANSGKSPGLARLCLANPDLLMTAIDPELPLRSVCHNKELSFAEAREFVSGIKGDLHRRYAEALLNTRAYNCRRSLKVHHLMVT